MRYIKVIKSYKQHSNRNQSYASYMTVIIVIG